MTAFRPDHDGAAVRRSPNFGERREGLRPELLVLHYTGMSSGQAAEDWLCNPTAEVSCHYVVHEDGRVVQLVREVDRAWHAGKSSWHGVTDINSQSIGIETVNPGHTIGYRAFPRRQIDAVIDLCRGIIRRHDIRPEMVLGHSDIAPGRKIDPGEKFPWTRLYREGVGCLVPPSRATKGPSMGVGDEGAAVSALQAMLVRYGYGIEINGTYDQATRTVVDAFQRHFRRANVDGIADAATVATLRNLLRKLVPAHAERSRNAE